MNNSFFLDNSISRIISLINSDQLTIQEIRANCLEGIKENNKHYHAFVFTDPISLSEVYKMGNGIDSFLLNGIPFGVEDVINVAEYPLSGGNYFKKGFTPGNDSRVVHMLKNSGAFVVGKTATKCIYGNLSSNDANTDILENTRLFPVNSSAVSVASGMVPFTIARQTCAEIIATSSLCGVYGYKPSYGLLPRTGVLTIYDTLDCIGFITSHISNIRTIFDVLHVQGRDYPFSHKALTDSKRQIHSEIKPWKIAFIRTCLWDSAADYIKESIATFIKRLAATSAFDVEDVEVPLRASNIYDNCMDFYNITSSFFLNKYNSNKFKNKEIKIQHDITAKDYSRVLSQQSTDIHLFDSFLKNYDIIISMSTLNCGPLKEGLFCYSPAFIWTYLHLPSISVPMFKSISGLPFGLQFSARKYNDYLLLNFLDELSKMDFCPSSSCSSFNLE